MFLPDKYVVHQYQSQSTLRHHLFWTGSEAVVALSEPASSITEQDDEYTCEAQAVP